MKIEKYFDKQIGQDMWRIDVTVNNRRHRRGKFATRRNAETAISGLIVLAQSEQYGLPSPVPPVSIEELLDKAELKCPRPIQKNLITAFREAVDTQKAVTSLKRVDMARFLEILQKRELKPGTVAHYKQTLYSILNRAGEWFAELDDWYPPKFPRLEKPTARDRVLTVDELARLIAAWQRPDCYARESAKWRDYRLELLEIVKLMLLTAARREELEKITPLVIDRRDGWLKLKSGKSGRWHVVPLNAAALELLQRRSTRTPMFAALASSTIHYCCQRVGQAAEIPFGQEVNHGWTIHDMRRTAASYIESRGIAYSAVSATLGYRRQDVTSVYTPAQITEMRRASELLQTHWREIDGAVCELCEPWKIKTA